jgi:hypothetical protein
MISLNMPASTEDKSDGSSDSFYKELEHEFRHFRKYRTNIVLQDFSTKLKIENIFKGNIWSECLHECSTNYVLKRSQICCIKISNCQDREVTTSKQS